MPFELFEMCRYRFDIRNVTTDRTSRVGGEREKATNKKTNKDKPAEDKEDAEPDE